MLTRSSALVYVAIPVLLATSVSCRRQQDDAPPVAEPSLTLSRERAPIGSPLGLTYRFEVAPDAKIDGDYLVFVHVLDQDAEQLWDDDHAPEIPTSAWQPGQTVEYSRMIFIPNYPYIGPAHIRIGLYQPSSGQRLPLAGNEITRREYEVARFQLLPQSENVFLIYKEGWHPAEVSPDNPTVEWQWTRKAATISFRNPKRDSTLYLQYDARPDQFTAPQQITVRLGEAVVDTLTADSRDIRLVTLPITADQLGTADIAELTLDVDRTFTPGGSDTRDLGIRIFHLFLEPH